jgi:Ca2+/Na+ antiporter
MLTNFFPILKMSRFPIGDYKIFIIISIILFSLIELQTNLQKITKKETIINILKLLFIYFLLNISALIIYKDDLFKRNMHFLLLNTLYLTYFIYAIKNKKINFYLLLILISLDGIFFLKTYKNPTQKVNTWQLSWPQFVLQRDETINNNSSLSTFTRPPRIDEKKYPNSILDGYLSNKFIAGDYGGTKLNNLQIINSNTIYNKYLNKEWQALFINCNSKDVICDKNYIQIQDDNFFNQDYKNDIVSQMIYQTDTILYKINSENDFIFTENEIFFPGWNGYINGKQFKSIPTNKVFRTWNLPKGNYYFLAKFDLPYQKTFYFVSIISVIFYIYLTIHIIVFKNNKFIYQANKIK